jgi:hypothetical protein
MADSTDHGQNPALATKGRARAKGNLEKITHASPPKAEKAEPQGKGLRAESEKDFKLDADSKPQEMIRVFDKDPNNPKEDVVLFSGSREQAKKVYEQLSKFLPKK